MRPWARRQFETRYQFGIAATWEFTETHNLTTSTAASRFFTDVLVPRFSMTIAMKDSIIPTAVSPAKQSITVLILFSPIRRGSMRRFDLRCNAYANGMEIDLGVCD